MKKSSLLTALLVSVSFSVCNLLSTGVLAQTVIYNENFDGVYALPLGWHATPNSWIMDSSANNSSAGQYPGATGLNNVVVQNQSAAPGYDTLFSKSISTVGYSNITAIWAARNTTHFSDSGSAITGLYWSTDAVAWNAVAYTENGNNSTWAIDNGGTAIALPAGAANQASLQLAWVAKIVTSGSGTYRIDDLFVAGTPANGITAVDDNLARVYCSNSLINIVLPVLPEKDLAVEICDITGHAVYNDVMRSQTLAINTSNFSSGIYLVRVSNDKQSSVSKVFVK